MDIIKVFHVIICAIHEWLKSLGGTAHKLNYTISRLERFQSSDPKTWNPSLEEIPLGFQVSKFQLMS